MEAQTEQVAADTRREADDGRRPDGSMRQLLSSSATYVLADGLARGATVLVVPLYTRALSPTDFGILAVTSTVTILFTTILGLSLDSALTRLYFEAKGEEDRSRLYGTVLLFTLGAPLLVMGLIEILGAAGVLNVFDKVPYSPYLRYALWAAYLGAIGNLPVAVYIARVQPRKVVALRVLNTGLQIGITVLLVVALDQGVIGALRGALFSAAASAVVAVVLMFRMSSLRFSRATLAVALAYSLPLLPHLLSHWTLNLSDRFILQGFVSPAQLGIYSLGYSVGLIATLITTAFSRAVMPTMVTFLKDPVLKNRVPSMGTYSFLALAAICLAIAVLGGPAVRFLTPPEFHEAARIVPVVALSYVALAAYIIVSQGAWFAMRTGWIAIGTLSAGLVNVGLTVALAGPLGIMGAAISTFVSYAALALFQGVIADRVYPIAWEYGRLVKIEAAALTAYFPAALLGNETTIPGVIVRLVVAMLSFLALVSMLSFWRPDERARIRSRVLRHLRVRQAAGT